MDSNASPPPSHEKKNRRRKRDDEQGRDHICTCGKAYLSYPALYTHIKTKHGGMKDLNKQPDQPIEKKLTKPKEKAVQNQKPQEQEKDIIEAAAGYLTKRFPKEEADLQDSQIAAPALSVVIPSNISIKDMNKQHQSLIDRIISYWAHRVPKDEVVDQSGTYATTIDYVLGRFLIMLIPKISKRATKFLIYFMIAFYEGVNKIKKNDSENFCTNSSAYNVPMLFNEMPISQVPDFAQKEEFLRNTVLICKTTYFLGKWLYQERYTNFDLKFNAVG